MRYSIEPRDRIYVKEYGFLSFAKNIGKSATKVAKSMSNKYSQNLFDSANKSTADAVKTASERAIQITAEETDGIIIMEYQKILNLLHNTSNQPSKSKIKNWVEVNDESRETYKVNSQIKFRTTMLKSSLCHYSDAYIRVKGNLSVDNTAAAPAAANNINKKVIFQNCASFTDCIIEINNKKVDNAKDIDIVMPVYNLIEYSDNYSKNIGKLMAIL